MICSKSYVKELKGGINYVWGVCMWVQMCMHVCMCLEDRAALVLFIRCFLTVVLKQGILLLGSVTRWVDEAGWPLRCRDLPSSTPPALGLNSQITTPDFFYIYIISLHRFGWVINLLESVVMPSVIRIRIWNLKQLS